MYKSQHPYAKHPSPIGPPPHHDLTESNDLLKEEPSQEKEPRAASGIPAHHDLTESNDLEQHHPDLTESNDINEQPEKAAGIHGDLTESNDASSGSSGIPDFFPE